MKKLISIIAIILCLSSCQSRYCEIRNARFFLNDTPFYYAGTFIQKIDSLQTGNNAIVKCKANEIINNSLCIVALDAQDSCITDIIKSNKRNTAILAWELQNAGENAGELISTIRKIDSNHLIGLQMDGVISTDEDDYINKVYQCALSSKPDYLCFNSGDLSKYNDQLTYIRRMQKPCVFVVSNADAIETIVADFKSSVRSGDLLGGIILEDNTTLNDVLWDIDTCNTRYVAYSKNLLQVGTKEFDLEICFRNQNPDEEVNIVLISDTTLLKEIKDTVRNITRKFDNGQNVVKLGKLNPGFYQVNVSGIRPFNIGVNPEKIVSPSDKPSDFDQFWQETLAELSDIPLDVQMKFIPEYSNEQRRTYEVSFKSFGGATMGGILTEPVAEGKYPVVIEYMGYGATPYYRHPSEHPDRLEFMVSVRDQGIFKEGHEKWIGRGVESKENFYYRGAYCDVVRALDYVCSLPKADTSHIFVWGESQGGAFTWISASLDHRVKAIAPSVPFMGDFPDYQNIVKWPMNQIKYFAKESGVSDEDVMNMLRYFDLKHFVDKVTCPVYMAFGLQDITCPPHTNFAPYNIATAPKKYMCIPQSGHSVWAQREWLNAKEEFFFGAPSKKHHSAGQP